MCSILSVKENLEITPNLNRKKRELGKNFGNS